MTCERQSATWTARNGDTVAHVHEEDGLVCIELPWGQQQWVMVDWLLALRIAWLIIKYATVACWVNRGARKPQEG